jgi:hypothetical protein
MARKAFPNTVADIRKLARDLINHLRKNLKDTHGQKDWTSRNFEVLRNFSNHDYDLKHFPPDSTSNQKGAFLWDYIAYQQGDGILIAAESEHNSKDISGLKHDIEKLFYVQAPIKLFLFWQKKDDPAIEETVQALNMYMKECCSTFTPGDIFILYCRTWATITGSSDDRVYLLQIPGEPPNFCNLKENFLPERRFFINL